MLVAPGTIQPQKVEATSQKKAVLLQKLGHPLVLVLLVLGAAGAAVGVALFGLKIGILLLALLFGLPVVAGVLINPRFGVLVVLVFAYLLMWTLRLGVNFPMGTLMDGLQALMILSFFMQQKRQKNWQAFRSPIAYVILAWVAYNFLQIANPTAESRLSWVYTIRSTAIVMLMYFIFVLNIRTVQLIRTILKIWLALSLFAALYAFKQEHFGFFQFEENWLNSDPLIRDLLFIDGHWRKFSIFSDPVAFAYNMAVSSILCIALITGPLALKKKIVLGFCAGFFLLNMLYSGTRGAYVLVPAALFLLLLLKFNKRMLFFGVVAGLFIGFLIVVPTSNPNIVRFQTAFKPSDDPSFNVRKINQKRIQPFILSHPLGGGLGATGVWGKRFAPGSMLANFPPDSGYVRVAVEMGWIGLFLLCLLMFIILKSGIKHYFSIRDKELQTYCLAATLMVFAFHIGNYPQEAIVQFPSNIYFYLCVALITLTKQLDGNAKAIG